MPVLCPRKRSIVSDFLHKSILCFFVDSGELHGDGRNCPNNSVHLYFMCIFRFPVKRHVESIVMIRCLFVCYVAVVD